MLKIPYVILIPAHPIFSLKFLAPPELIKMCFWVPLHGLLCPCISSVSCDLDTTQMTPEDKPEEVVSQPLSDEEGDCVVSSQATMESLCLPFFSHSALLLAQTQAKETCRAKGKGQK